MNVVNRKNLAVEEAANAEFEAFVKSEKARGAKH